MKHSYLFLIGCIWLFACQGNKTAKPGAEKSKPAPTGQTDHHEHTGQIELNNGKKWKVVPEMLRYIRTMEHDVLSFRSADMGDYKTLSSSLRKNIDELTSHCTMTGKAHDELHKWLLPYIDLINAFSDCENVTEASVKLNEIKQSFVRFNMYFE